MSHALLRIEELRAAEQAAQAGLPPGTLMARAGRAAADAITHRYGARRLRCAIVCGPGNNGGDGYVVARELTARGHEVVCITLAPPAAADARSAADAWRATGGSVLDTLPDRSGFDVTVDALFGIGLTRPLAADALAAVRWLQARRPVVALDVPSGLDVDRGCWVGGVSGVEADMTVTFIADKPGLHTGAGVDAAGAVVVAPLAFAVPPGNGVLVTTAELATLARPRRRDTHKGSFGSVAVVGGGRSMVGAALLAARAALRLGAGRVYVDAIGAPDLRVDPLQPELMFRALGDLADVPVLVAGCGLGTDDAAHAVVSAVLASAAALVLDADALNLIAASPELSAALQRRSAPTVLTPHPLEAARLLGSTASEVQRDRIGAAQTLAMQTHATVLLKGAGSVIAEGSSRYAINPTGSPALATAGTGDVLAGMIGALLAQGFSAWDATTGAAWLHGRAAEDIGDVGLVASDIAPRAAAALRQLRATAA